MAWKIVYKCCDEPGGEVEDNAEAYEKMAEHIHSHRLGTKETVRECSSCHAMAYRALFLLRDRHD